MKKSKYFATTVGVIIVVAVVVISTTLWLQRPAGQSQEDLEEAKDGTADIRKLTGTLVITPTVRDPAKLGIANNYWVYIEGCIVATKPSPRDAPSSLDSFDVLLVPGEYELEVAVRRPGYVSVYDEHFPFSFASQKVLVEAGETATVKISVEHDWGIRQSGGYNFSIIIDGDITWEEWYDKVVERVNIWIKEYQQDEAFLAINDVFIALQQSPPLRPVVYINLPEDYGGGREYDARQVRKIVTWFRSKLSIMSWSLRRIDASIRDSMPTTIRQKYEQLETQVSLHEESIERFNYIAEKLEQVEKAER